MVRSKEDLTCSVIESYKCGPMKVLVDKGDYLDIMFLNTGTRMSVNRYACKGGSIKDPNHPSIYGVAFMGMGPYKPTLDGNTTSAYRVWLGILGRCYGENNESRVFYGSKGTYVNPLWLNFQTFAHWYYLNHKEGFEIDKDILAPLSKCYGPDTCCMVPKKINLAVKTAASEDNWATYTKKSGELVYSPTCTVGGKTVALGRFTNKEEATLAYKNTKESMVRDLATEYYENGLLEDYIYDALMKWECILGNEITRRKDNIRCTRNR